MEQMSRLIDADKLIEEMSTWYWDKEKQKASEEDVSPMDLFTHLAITTVQEQPTAFDVDEVVQQLEMLIEDKVSESGDDWYTAECLNEAVEIVKGGGVDGN
jgi:hypothetical protein